MFDLPPEDCAFIIAEAGVADSEQVEYPVGGGETAEAPKKKKKAKVTALTEEALEEV